MKRVYARALGAAFAILMAAEMPTVAYAESNDEILFEEANNDGEDTEELTLDSEEFEEEPEL